jgi:hypothetical protein
MGSTNVAGLSPDALLEYCSTQMNGLDSQINSLMKQQETQLNQEQAVQTVQSTLDGFGSTGPTTGAEMQQCVDAFNTAIKDLGPNDPVAGQLQTQLSAMEAKYGTPGTLTDAQQTQLTSDANTLSAVGPGGVALATSGFTTDNTVLPGGFTAGQVKAAQKDQQALQAQQAGSFQAPSGSDWTGTTDAASNLASNIKSNAQLQFLTLQDLVSQQQDAIEQATNMMSKEDNTLLDQAKAIGA